MNQPMQEPQKLSPLVFDTVGQVRPSLNRLEALVTCSTFAHAAGRIRLHSHHGYEDASCLSTLSNFAITKV